MRELGDMEDRVKFVRVKTGHIHAWVRQCNAVSQASVGGQSGRGTCEQEGREQTKRLPYKTNFGGKEPTTPQTKIWINRVVEGEEELGSKEHESWVGKLG